VTSAVTSPNRGPRADVRQVFQRNPTRRVFGPRDQGFADAVVGMAAEVGLTAGKPPERLLRALRPAPLKAASVLLLVMSTRSTAEPQ
jgi:hypothetical protein